MGVLFMSMIYTDVKEILLKNKHDTKACNFSTVCRATEVRRGNLRCNLFGNLGNSGKVSHISGNY